MTGFAKRDIFDKFYGIELGSHTSAPINLSLLLPIGRRFGKLGMPEEAENSLGSTARLGTSHG